ncbi:MAG TPA: hypothetical protein PLE48_11800 [Thiobacillus sp.]|nr:MAG: hypothetical protein B7Y50_13670 [Hydrogenophilales bacterium 28-61-11]OYZ56495.1 MAG: hypothetical protein B7Y21_11360 [Hydrogenophilales bacterium 16-61-112]OZA42812.1 MAG: hypothetical protein B7X81_12355 [Hydrogenophilales bacterium 17-61-76]HQT31563.1 hypothetical protein [Thiobacillus sp.]HQT71092.1 hypothetical protein [Thiobacillus sp.]
MSKLLLALTSAALLGLTGCASTSEPAAQSAPTTISAEAQSALSAAQADVKAAKAKSTLWTTAENALKAAEDAAAKLDSATVIKQSKLASEQVKLGNMQAAYPVLKVGE